MSAQQYIYNILTDNWMKSRSGRTHDVPEPPIEIKSNDPQPVERKHDHINVVDGGDELHTPRGVGFNERDVDSFVTIQIRTTVNPPDPPNVEDPGLVRFEGWRDSNNEFEAWSGLRGEVEKILVDHRKGEKEFSLVEFGPWRDESGNQVKKYYRGAWDVGLRIIGESL